MPDIDQVARSQVADLTLQIAQTAAAVAAVTANPITFTYNQANASASGVPADIFGSGIIKVLVLSGWPAAGSAYTLPSITSIAAALPILTPGMTFGLRIMNLGPQTWTVAAPAGWSLNGVMTIATGTWRDFQILYTSPAAMLLTDMGTGTTLAPNYPFWGVSPFTAPELTTAQLPSKPSDQLWPSLWPPNPNEAITNLLHTWAIPLTNAPDPIDPIMLFGPTSIPAAVVSQQMTTANASLNLSIP